MRQRGREAGNYKRERGEEALFLSLSFHVLAMLAGERNRLVVGDGRQAGKQTGFPPHAPTLVITTSERNLLLLPDYFRRPRGFYWRGPRVQGSSLSPISPDTSASKNDSNSSEERFEMD